MKKYILWEDIIGIVLLASSAIMMGTSAFLCLQPDLWADELFTIGLCNRPYADLIDLTARDVHPPLYYIIVRTVFILGRFAEESAAQVIAAKLIALCPFFFSFLYAVTLVRKNFGLLTSGVFLFMLTSMTQMPAYAIEIRMYGFAFFFVLAGMLHAFEISRFRKNSPGNSSKIRGGYFHWICLTLYSIAACYTHYFACAAAVMIYISLFADLAFSRKLKSYYKVFLTSGILCVLCYLPWLLAAAGNQVRQVKEDYWIAPLSFMDLVRCARFIFGPLSGGKMESAVVTVLTGGTWIFLFLKDFKTLIQNGSESDLNQKRTIVFTFFCQSILAGLILFGFTASFLIRPVFVPRYMMPAMGVFWLGFSLSIVRQKKRRNQFLPVLLLVFLLGVYNYDCLVKEETMKKNQMRSAESVLLQVGTRDKVLFNWIHPQSAVAFYLKTDAYLWGDSPGILIEEMFPRNHSLSEENDSDTEGIRQIREWLQNGNKVWFFESKEKDGDIILNELKNEGIIVESRGNILIERYRLEIYSLQGE